MYLMEDPRESQRLTSKVEPDAWVRSYLHDYLPTRTVLDIGCGPGVIAHSIGAQFPSTLVFGVDASSARVAEAIKTTERIPNVTIRHGTASRLQFADDTFDLVYCRFLL